MPDGYDSRRLLNGKAPFTELTGVKRMTIFNFISSILSYVFTFIIYVFIFLVIRLIYMDVKKMSRFEENSVEDTECASLRPIKSKVPLTHELHRRYTIYDEAVIGRGKDCDIVINEKFVSIKHAIIWREDDEWYLDDLGSRNGTQVNGQRIKQEVVLEPQDVISIGGLNFVFDI